MLAPVRTTAPAETPVSLDEAKAHCRVDHDDDNAVITTLIAAAAAYVDGWTGVLGRCLVDQTWRISFRDLTAQCIRLPFPNVSTATVTYYDTDNAEQTVAAGDFTILADACGSFIRFDDSFAVPSLYDDRLDAVQVEFTAGYGDAADVPAAIKAAILLLVGHYYENREASVIGASVENLPMGVDALLAPYRRVGV
jgi:uncharacterized phiE125 gp8 family phage protein